MMQKEFLNDIKTAVDVLRKGGVILYPTDTVWGIGCDATNTDAVKRIYKIKQRADHKAMITLVADLATLERTVEKVPDVAYELIECTDRPLTIVYDRGVGVTPELMGEDKTLAVRLTTESFSAALCRSLRRPLVSTSANISGQPTPKCYSQISQELLDAVDYVCTSRRDEPVNSNARPSMVMRLSDDGLFKILRK